MEPIEVINQAFSELFIAYVVSIIVNIIAYVISFHWIIKQYEIWVCSPHTWGTIKSRYPNTVMYVRMIVYIGLLLILLGWVKHIWTFAEVVNILELIYESLLYDIGTKSV